MILEAEAIDSQKIETDVCIIGSGIAGGTIAVELSRANIPFVIVEAGGFTGNSDNVSIDNQGLDFGLSTTTSIELGGTSNLWHGVLAPLDPIDFKPRSWIPHSGWPISYETMIPYFEKASALFKIAKHEYFFEDLLSPALQEEAMKMPIKRAVVRNKLFQQPLPPLRFKNIVKKICSASKDYNCIIHATALELISNASNPKLIEEVIVAKNSGEKFSVHAKHFILAAGALETPRLLLNSRGSFPKGPGNEHDNVGRFLMDHPMGNLFQVEFKRKQKSHLYSDMKYTASCKIKSGLVLKDEAQEQYQLPNHNFYMRPSFVKGIDNESEKIKLTLLTFKDRNKRIGVKDVINVLSHFNVAYQILAYKLALNVTYQFADIFFLTEQVPDKNSRVKLSDVKDRNGYPIAQVNWQLTKQDMGSMTAYYELLRTKVFPNEHFIVTHRPEDLNWQKNLTSAAHHVGTARMASSAREGVIDSDQKVFDTENLYVSDGSLFTTGGNINSGFSISAFSIRLAERLIKKIKNSKR